jgi:hypothetical protein
MPLLPLRRRPLPGGCALGFVVFTLLACRPADDWRELRWPDAPLSVRFPCKPDQQRPPAGPTGPTGLLAQCEHEGVLYALASQSFATPQSARDGLAAIPSRWPLRASEPPGPVPGGALAWPGSGRWHGGDRQRRLHLMVWAQGMTVYQATVVGTGDATAASAQAARFFDQIQPTP